MQKKFFSSLVLLIALNLLVKPFAIFGIDATIQNRVGAEDYGLYFSLLNLSFLFNIVMDIGINNFTTRNIAQYPEIVSKYLGKLFSFRLILFGFYALITLILGSTLGYSGQELYLLTILVINQFLVILIAYFRSHFGGLHLFKTDAIVSVLDRMLLILGCGYILLNPTDYKMTITLFIWIQFYCYLITLVLSFLLLVRAIGLPQFKFSWVFSYAILKKSYPYALLILLMMLYTRIDSVMIQRLHANGSYETGLYAQGFRLLDAFFMFGMIFANLLLPMFSRLLKKDANGLAQLLRISRNLLVGGSMLVSSICILHADFLLQLIYRHDIHASVPSFKLLMWTFIPMCSSLIYSTLITASGNLKFLNQLSVVSIGVNIAINALLIPIYGAFGAGIATLITQSLTALIQLFYVHKHFSLDGKLIELVQFSILGAILLMLSLMLPSTPFTILLHITIGLLTLFLTKLIDLKTIKNNLFQQ